MLSLRPYESAINSQSSGFHENYGPVQWIMLHLIHPAVREANQSKIGKLFLTFSLCEHLNPNFKESGLQTLIL